MTKKYSKKFWLSFWLIAAIFLFGWYTFLETREVGLGGLKNFATPVIDFLPFNKEKKQEYKAATEIAKYFLNTEGAERTVLVLFQNNLEIRPGGGFIGAFGIVKIQDGGIKNIEIHDLSNFDKRVPRNIEPPYPMKETLHIDAWQMRDSNFSPDFEVNAKKAEEFYYLGNGGEKFDAIIGMTGNVFSSILSVLGPVTIEGYPDEYNSENALLTLEYQVEKAFDEQGVDRRDRKNIMGDLANEISNKISNIGVSEKIDLAKELINSLNKKDIQLYFKDQDVQSAIGSVGWDGKVKEGWKNDYLMVVDANLGAFKSDYYIKRTLDYSVDLTKEKPLVKVKINYNHTATKKDWMTRDYVTYLRLYVPEGAWLFDSRNFYEVQFGQEFGKKYFGSVVRVPIGTEKKVEVSYYLPEDFDKDNYDLMIQKQAGILDVPVKLSIKYPDGEEKSYEYKMNSDFVLSVLTK